MAKLRLSIKSTAVLDVYGIVDVVFNGTTLVSAQQLSATVENLEYNADILPSAENTLTISLVNDQAIDTNADGDFNDASDQTMRAIVSELSYSLDNVNYTTLLPQTEENHTIPSGTHAGESVILRPNITEFIIYGADYAVKFDSLGLLNTTYLQGYFFKLVDGIYYDANGNVVPN
jgi:hypothetical protein